MTEAKEFRSSRGKTVLYLLLSLGFVIPGSLVLGRTPDDVGLWLAVGFFGLGALTFTILLARPQRLTLDQDGFTVSGGLMLKPSTTRWRDVDGFFVYHLPKGGKMIGFNYAQGARPETGMLRISRRLGADGALPRSWAGSPEAMADELNAFRARALGID